MLGQVYEGWYKNYQKYKKESWVVCKIGQYKLRNYLYKLKQLRAQGHLSQTILACNLVYSYKK